MPLDTTKFSAVTSLVVSGADVYAGGFSVNSSGVTVAGYWKNDAWIGLSSLDSSKNAAVASLVVAVR